MHSVVSSEKPCTVPAGQGFSVFYKNRYLYSRHSPDKSILQTIRNLEIREGTLVLCFSPCLWYGFDVLLQRIPESCYILACEADPDLYELSRNKLEPTVARDSRCSFVPFDRLAELPELLQKTVFTGETFPGLPPPGTFRRVLRIDFSAGVRFHEKLYDALYYACGEAVSQFWKNRLTLIRFGRQYSRNLFKNLAQLPFSVPLTALQHTVLRPILVAGAGESLQQTLTALGPLLKKCFVISVDAALPVFLAQHLTPDAVIGLECQLAIEKAYIGTASDKFLFFSDMVARPHTAEQLGVPVCYFVSKYADTNFFKNLSDADILPPVLEPLGSVGLAAVRLAQMLRKSTDVGIFTSGLDFSYTAGLTHTRGAPAHTERLISTFRLNPIPNYAASFSPGAKTITGKDGGSVITTAVLEGYAKSFTGRFTGMPNLFDAGSTGCNLGIPHLTEEELLAVIAKTENTDLGAENPSNLYSRQTNTALIKKITCFYEEEKKALNQLKQILVHGNGKNRNSLIDEILSLLKEREYLYLHFPDGWKLSESTSFLNRVRIETDFFLKDIDRALNRLSEK